jgi:hypothetical protein
MQEQIFVQKEGGKIKKKNEIVNGWKYIDT